MADAGSVPGLDQTWTPPLSLEEARARARERFKSRLESGEKIGECGCGDDGAVIGAQDDSPAECVVGVRFRDSGRLYYFRSGQEELDVGDWVVTASGRGQEAARVVIAPHQVRRALLQGELGRVVRRVTDADSARMAAQKQRSGEAVRRLGERARARRIGLKSLAADFSFDGEAVALSYSVPDREHGPDAAALRDLAQELAADLGSRVELRQVGPRDEARLLGGLGRCGRTLCCSSWLPVFPEISMSMAKNQDLPLNPSKVSGVCGRLLCCLSYENDQYRQMKAVMPKLGQTIETPGGAGQVVSLHLLKELVTVRLENENGEIVFRADELDLGGGNAPPRSTAPAAPAERVQIADAPVAEENGGPDESGQAATATGRRRRRRRSGRRGGGGA
jgi:cell fate regulator YaaT (PSP1 superfamily)